MTMLSMTVQPGIWASTGMIAAVVLCSTAGEVLTASAMKSIGDLDEIRARSGMKGAILAVVTCPRFYAGVGFLALAFFSPLRAESFEPRARGTRGGLAHARYQRNRRKILPE